MKILVIGSGGREHAIVTSVTKSNLVSEVFVAPGNYGTNLIAKNINIKVDDIEGLLAFALDNKIALTIVGPEISLMAGVVDLFKKHNLLILGPSKAASMIEGSKEYAKKLMAKYDIPTAKYQSFTNSIDAINYVKSLNTYPIVIKYDGLAAGKGVFLPDNEQDTIKIIKDVLDNKMLGNDGIIIEEFLVGEEFTLLSLVNNDKVYPFQVARDFKRIYDHDEGENTGGMGAICPYDKISSKQLEEAINILNKTAQAMVSENNNFSGVLYGGFIATKNGVKVIEYNARFGDPETQCVLSNLSSDLVENILSLLNEKEVKLTFHKGVNVGLVLSAKGYPGVYEKDVALESYLKLPFNLYHMASYTKDNKVLSNGGRVLFIETSASSSKEGFNNIYNELNNLPELLHYRKDLINY